MFRSLMSWDNNRGPWGQRPRSGGGNGGGTQRPPELDEFLRTAQERFRRSMGGGSGGSGGDGSSVLGLAAVAGVVLWLASGFYIVAPDEQGVVLRFGKYVATTNPGPNYHLPYPIETVLRPKVTRENIEEIGFRTAAAQNSRVLQTIGRTNGGQALDVGRESLMLTGDENIVDVDFTVRWKVADPRAFLFNVDQPSETIKSLAESAMREVVGTHPIDDALTANRAQIQQAARERMQAAVDLYRMGVMITAVELQQVNPPEQVIDAFRDVQAARADAEKMQNEALGYANDILPRARGQVAQVIQQAEGYKSARVAEAKGLAERFTTQVDAYQRSREVNAKRLYLETMEEVLRDSRKVVLTGEAGRGILPYLPLATPAAPRASTPQPTQN